MSGKPGQVPCEAVRPGLVGAVIVVGSVHGGTLVGSRRGASRSASDPRLARPNEWLTRTRAVARRLHIPIDVPLTGLVTTAARWDSDRRNAVEAQVQNVPGLRDRIAAQEQLPDTERWAPLARQVDPRLVRAATWPPLADAFAEAARAGHDLPTLLQDVLARGPLDSSNPALDLQSRLLEDLDPEPTPWSLPIPESGESPGHTFAARAPRRPALPVALDPSNSSRRVLALSGPARGSTS